MIVFNTVALVELIVAAIPGLILYFVLGFAGVGDPTWWGTAIALSLMVPIDLIARLANMAGDEDEGDPGAGPMAFIWPNGGGHIFFVPVWIGASLLAVASLMGMIPMV